MKKNECIDSDDPRFQRELDRAIEECEKQKEKGRNV